MICKAMLVRDVEEYYRAADFAFNLYELIMHYHLIFVWIKQSHKGYFMYSFYVRCCAQSTT